MKELYSFNEQENQLVNETEITKNEKGEEVSVTKKVTKPITRRFVLKRPSRLESETTEVFRASMESEYIKKGILPIALLQKRFIQDGGIFSEKEKQEHEKLSENFFKLQSEYNELTKTPEKERSEEVTKKIEELVKTLTENVTKFNELENITNGLYNRSAEALARNRSILQMVLMLSYEDKNGKVEPVFGPGDFDKKLEVYDRIEEEEKDFDYNLIQKLLFLFSMYYMGKVSTKDEFDSALVIFNNQNLLK